MTAPDLAPAEFAGRAARAEFRGRAIDQGVDPDSIAPPLPDRASALLKMLDALTAARGTPRYPAMIRQATAAAAAVSKDSGPNIILIRGGRALVPGIVEDGSVGYSAWKFRDLDIEEYEGTQSRVLFASELLMEGKPIDAGMTADLIQQVREGTDATEREAMGVVELLGQLDGVEPPETLIEFQIIATTLLGQHRRGFEILG